MQTYILKTHWSVYCFMSPFVLLSMFLLFVEPDITTFVLPIVFLLPVLLFMNIQVTLSETSLIFRSELRKVTTIPYSSINRIELFTGEEDKKKGMLSIVVKGSFEGGEKVIRTVTFDHKDIFTLIRKLCQNTPHAETSENVKKIIEGNGQKILSKSFKEAVRIGIKSSIK